jgi:general stress protein 26
MLSDQELLSRAIHVVNDHFVGMLTTVDAENVPHARWMGSSTAASGLSTLYTLTGRKTRKLAHLAANPNVCWVFSSPDYQDVVTLWGRAEVLEAPSTAQSVWDRLIDAARTYCMSTLEDDPQFVTLQTHVQRGEMLSPRLKLFTPRPLKLAMQPA